MFCCLATDRPDASAALEAVARACSPRIERHGDAAVVFDVRGLQRVVGPAPVIAEETRRLARAQGLDVRVAIAGTITAAWLLAHTRDVVTIVSPGQEAEALASLNLECLNALVQTRSAVVRPVARARQARPRSWEPGAKLLASDLELLAILARWGLRTLGQLAQLSEADVRTRLGDAGGRLHRAARGQDAAPLVPVPVPVRFLERLELEWPIEGLEPLSFVLARLCDTLSATLEQADRGAIALITRLRLVTRAWHERTLTLPAPMRDARVLRTLILLDLESHSPPGAIEIVEVELGVTPGRIVQGSLLSRSLPSPEDLATLIARLGALMGDTRIGAPALVDTYDERAVAMSVFAPTQISHHVVSDQDRDVRLDDGSRSPTAAPHRLAPTLRRFRLPIAAEVTLEHGAPASVRCSAVKGLVTARAGPWRSSGHWWALDRTDWNRDTWEVALPDGIYRLIRDRSTGRWEIDGIVD